MWRNLGALQFNLVANSGLPVSSGTYVHELAVGDTNGDTNGDTWPDVGVAFFAQALLLSPSAVAMTPSIAGFVGP